MQCPQFAQSLLLPMHGSPSPQHCVATGWPPLTASPIWCRQRGLLCIWPTWFAASHVTQSEPLRAVCPWQQSSEADPGGGSVSINRHGNLDSLSAPVRLRLDAQRAAKSHLQSEGNFRYVNTKTQTEGTLRLGDHKNTGVKCTGNAYGRKWAWQWARVIMLVLSWPVFPQGTSTNSSQFQPRCP